MEAETALQSKSLHYQTTSACHLHPALGPESSGSQNKLGGSKGGLLGSLLGQR